MTKHIIFILLFTLIIISCKTLKYPTPKKDFSGTFKTCSQDSMVYLVDSVLKIVSSTDNINSECLNRPEYTKSLPTWPSFISLRFDQKEFIVSYKPRLYSDGKSMASSVDTGTLIYDKKNRTLTLHSVIFNWKRIYKCEYIEAENTLMLRPYKTKK